MPTKRIIDQPEAISLSSQDYLVADNSTLGTRKIPFDRLLSGATPLPPGYINGYLISEISSISFSVNPGHARSIDNLRNIVMSNALTKELNLSFVVGNGGCMPDNLTLQAVTKYSVFAISTAGGVTDIIVDTDDGCANGLSDATVVANNFNKYVKIGEIETDSNSEISSITLYWMEGKAKLVHELPSDPITTMFYLISEE